MSRSVRIASLALVAVLAGCTSSAPADGGKSALATSTPAGGEPWRVPGSSTTPQVAWSVPYIDPGDDPDRASFTAVPVGSDPTLLVFASMGADTSTAEGEHLVVQALNLDTGEPVWSTDVSATLGVDRSWASLWSLTATPDGAGVVAVIEADSPQSSWVVRLNGTDGRLAGQVELDRDLYAHLAVTVGGTVVVPAFDTVAGFSVDDLAAGPVWQVPYANPTGDENAPENEVLPSVAALTDGLAAVGVDLWSPGTERIVVDVTTGEVAPGDVVDRVLVGVPLPTERDGVWLVAAESTLQAIDSSGRELWPAVQCAGFSTEDQGGGWMMTAGSPGDVLPCVAGAEVDLLDLNTGEVTGTVQVTGDPVYAFVVDQRLFTVGEGGTTVYDLASGDELLTSPVYVPPVWTDWWGASGLAVGADGDTVFFADGESLQGFDLSTGTVLWSVPYDGNVMVTGGHVIVRDHATGSIEGLSDL